MRNGHLSAALGIGVGLVCSASAQRATNAVQQGCKQGYTYHEEAGMRSSSSGCYKVFSESLNWTDAKARCEDRSLAGVNGALAAARSQTEQDFLMNIAEEHSWGLKFWLAGSSVKLPPYGGSWAWGPPYYLDVRFRETNWTNGMIVNTLPRGVKDAPEYLNDMALLNGHRGAYAWKISNTTEEHPFICWKRSCAAGQDMLDGICQPNAYSILNPAEEEEKDESWIASVVVIAVILAGLMLLLGLWKFHNPLFVYVIVSVTACCQNKKQQEQLSNRLSASGGIDGDDVVMSEFVPAFAGPDRRSSMQAMGSSEMSGAFVPVAAPLSNIAGSQQKPKTPAIGALPKMTSLTSASSVTKRSSFAKL